MSRKPIPDREAPMIDDQGRITPPWLEYFRDLDQRCFAQKINFSDTPGNGETPLYNAASGQWDFGAN